MSKSVIIMHATQTLALEHVPTKRCSAWPDPRIPVASFTYMCLNLHAINTFCMKGLLLPRRLFQLRTGKNQLPLLFSDTKCIEQNYCSSFALLASKVVGPAQMGDPKSMKNLTTRASSLSWTGPPDPQSPKIPPGNKKEFQKP